MRTGDHVRIVHKGGVVEGKVLGMYDYVVLVDAGSRGAVEIEDSDIISVHNLSDWLRRTSQVTDIHAQRSRTYLGWPSTTSTVFTGR